MLVYTVFFVLQLLKVSSFSKTLIADICILGGGGCLVILGVLVKILYEKSIIDGL